MSKSNSFTKMEEKRKSEGDGVSHHDFSFKNIKEKFLMNGSGKEKRSSVGAVAAKKNTLGPKGVTGNPDRLSYGKIKSVNRDEGYAPSESAVPTRVSTMVEFKKSYSHHNLASTSDSATSGQIPQKNKNLKTPVRKMLNTSKSSLSSLASVKRAGKQLNIESLMRNPEADLNDALRTLDSTEWIDKISAIEVIVALSERSPQIIINNIHAVSQGLLNECKNLRSTVSRAAIKAFGALFRDVGNAMDAVLEKVCTVLLQKAGDVSSAFIRDDASLSLEEMVRNASPVKVLNVLTSFGVRSKNGAIRSCCSGLLVLLLEHIGPKNVLHSEEFPKFLSALAVFAKDANATARYNGKHGIKLLSKDKAYFDKLLRKALNVGEIKAMQDVLESVKKGVENSSLDISSSSLAFIRGGSIRRSANLNRSTVVSQGVQHDLEVARKQLTANDWERRATGLREFENLLKKHTRAVLSDAKLLEAFIGRVSDINSKLSFEALNILSTNMDLFSSNLTTESALKSVLSQLINAIMAQLSSRNREVCELAQDCLDEMCIQIDNTTLQTPFASAAKQANIKQKPVMLLTLNKINQEVYKTKPRQMEIIALPVLWEVLRSPTQSRTSPDLREAVRTYVQGLTDCIGFKQIMGMATANLSSTQRKALDAILKG